MTIRSGVHADIALLRQSLRRVGDPHKPLLQLDSWRPVRDVAVDIATMGLAMFVAAHEPWATPPALLILGNRQRALGNILHDAAHRNLMRDRRVNDLVTNALIAPMLFLCLSRYRELHLRHHLDLGRQGADPDLIPIPAVKARTWSAALAGNALSLRAVLGSTFGHIVDRAVPLSGRVYIVAWWALLVLALALSIGAIPAATMLVLWLVARATVFHWITIFREMCDHHGLVPGGVFSFTRDIKASGLWSVLIHPRHNAYHLTHHLVPAIPYYRLPEAQCLFAALSEYSERAEVCQTYFSGPTAVVWAWQSDLPP